MIVKYFSKDFYRNWLGLKDEDVDHYNVIRAKTKLKQNWSLGAFEKETNKLVGVDLSVVQERGTSLHPQIKDFPRDDIKLSNIF